jgi:hypothetical protein
VYEFTLLSAMTYVNFVQMVRKKGSKTSRLSIVNDTDLELSLDAVKLVGVSMLKNIDLFVVYPSND